MLVLTFVPCTVFFFFLNKLQCRSTLITPMFNLNTSQVSMPGPSWSSCLALIDSVTDFSLEHTCNYTCISYDFLKSLPKYGTKLGTRKYWQIRMSLACRFSPCVSSTAVKNILRNLKKTCMFYANTRPIWSTVFDLIKTKLPLPERPFFKYIFTSKAWIDLQKSLDR